ncbi:DUF2798 domain-containing protein [Bradyrhizobium cenepequi]|uniref:DUF2798 domain-containing protein n=1 Tax=Bradyrhizobium cenepequi TaxID=2821403 RepID=UPI00289E2010|nr:DUF2798 domain-containing protein [Bradyrhizobium cenepequi]
MRSRVPTFRPTGWLSVSRRYAHFLYGVIQSGLTSAIAAAIASFDFLTGGSFLIHWLQSWLIAWVLMLPNRVVCSPHHQKIDALFNAGGSGVAGAHGVGQYSLCSAT